jgi:anaerobic glycerol-3-phosphate dehydrogenase
VTNTIQLAHGLDSKEKRATCLAAALQKLVQPGERIGLPAILGMEGPPDHPGGTGRKNGLSGV